MKRGVHVPLANTQTTGSPRYVSTNSHTVSQSPRDDLESLTYVLIHFVKRLPWQSVPGHTRPEKMQNIFSAKLVTPTSEVCRGVEPCFKQFLDYAKSLQYEQDPDYDLMRAYFVAEMKVSAYVNDSKFDWKQ